MYIYASVAFSDRRSDGGLQRDAGFLNRFDSGVRQGGPELFHYLHARLGHVPVYAGAGRIDTSTRSFRDFRPNSIAGN